MLRKPRPRDRAVIEALYRDSAAIHAPWTSAPKDFDAYLAEEARYFLCEETSGDIIGTFSLSHIVRGYFHSAYLGYEVFSPHQRKGLMRGGMALLIDEAFTGLNLHRIEANIQPGNLASIALVAKAGFVKEGFSKGYLNIGGAGWKDHERWALVNEQWQDNSF